MLVGTAVILDLGYYYWSVARILNKDLFTKSPNFRIGVLWVADVHLGSPIIITFFGHFSNTFQNLSGP